MAHLGRGDKCDAGAATNLCSMEPHVDCERTPLDRNVFWHPVAAKEQEQPVSTECCWMDWWEVHTLLVAHAGCEFPADGGQIELNEIFAQEWLPLSEPFAWCQLPADLSRAQPRFCIRATGHSH